MTVAAVMLVKDEIDIIGYTVEHLLTEVDHVYVLDNGSTDGTRELLDQYRGSGVEVIDDPEIGYWQSAKTTQLAERALADGHRWVIPCDADERWTVDRGSTLREFLSGQIPDVQLVEATMWNYFPTGRDDPSENPFARFGWRLPAPGALPKVACRTGPRLVIHAGNHSAVVDPDTINLAGGGLTVRHYSWRTREQYVRKILNGAAAYHATDLPDDIGNHWRMFGHDPAPERIGEHFDRHFVYRDPEADGLVYDPAIRQEAEA